MWDIRKRHILDSNLAKSRLRITNFSVVKPFWNFAQSTAVSMLCAKFQYDLTFEMHILDERDFVKFEFKVSFGWISYITQGPVSI